MIRFYKLFFLCCIILLLAGCQNKSQKIQPPDDSVLEVSDERHELQSVAEKTRFEEIISPIELMELPFSFYCGIDSYIWAEEYDSAIVKLVPEDWGVIGRLPAKGNNEYLIYGRVGDIIYPYLYVYDKTGQLLDSLYLHIGPCLGDESVVISNFTMINKDYSINMIDTTKHVHYEDNNERIIDSVFVTHRNLQLNKENLYLIANEERYKIEHK